MHLPLVPSMWVFPGMLIITLLTALAGCVITGEKFRWSTFLKSSLILGIAMLVNGLLLSTDSALRLGVSILGMVLSYFLAFRYVGRKLLLHTFILLMVTTIADLVMGAWFLKIYDSKTMEAMRLMLVPAGCFLQAACGTAMILVALIYRFLASLFSRYVPHVPSRYASVGYLVRPIVLILIMCVLFYQAMSTMPASDQLSRFEHILPVFVLILVLLLIGATYILQDLRSYRQLQENKALLYQQSLQSAMLQDTRVFRHNVSNMLYGFQGVLLSGDVKDIQEYYQSMAEACQMVNNENVIALKRIPSHAVSTLVLNKISVANQQHIPCYLIVAEEVEWPRVKDTDMTQVLGVLLDNALEAAAQSRAPHVSMDVRMEKGAFSITIRNTYAGEPPVFMKHMVSSKTGHEGLGLRSVRKILEKHPNVLFNIYTRGRYVEAVLTDYE